MSKKNTDAGEVETKSATSGAIQHPEIPKPNDVECYYDSGKKTYWTRNSKDEWHEINLSSLRLHLRYHGYRTDEFAPSRLNFVDHKVHEITHQWGVHYAGKVAGYHAGLHTIAGQKILVTRGPNLIEPKRGKCPMVSKLFDELLGKQKLYLYGWLKCARESLMAGPPWRPGQLLAIAGDKDCGKSMCQNLITEILGGRSAKPYRYMSGRTEFNGDLIGAEHLMLEDEQCAKDHKSREAFGSAIKTMTVCRTQSGHKKAADAETLTPFWRLTLTLNKKPENLLVLPPIDEDIDDKIILLSAAKATFPYGNDDLAGYMAYWRNLVAELPAFLFHLDRWKVPEELQSARFGIKAWHHPDLLEAVDSLSKERRLWEFIQSAPSMWGINSMWEGTAAELKKGLLVDHPALEVERLLSFPTACGMFLTTLARKLPGRVTVWKKSGELTKYNVLKDSK